MVHRILEEAWRDTTIDDRNGPVGHLLEGRVVGTLLQELTDRHEARPDVVGVGVLAAERVRAIAVLDPDSAQSLWGIGWRGELR